MGFTIRTLLSLYIFCRLVFTPLLYYRSFQVRRSDIHHSFSPVHPYMKVALSILTCVSKMILNQADRDVPVSRLLVKVSQVYAFIGKTSIGKDSIYASLAIYGK
ncbi:hypothetical protein BDR05DRAFT_961179 [Suillus weaverae]|nr:hypothetical protein BDR05DRAFT_961179 [Suillus weaverae]